LDYIKTQKWFWGVRADNSLLFYSAKRNGYVKYLKKEWKIPFAETLLIPLKKNVPVRVINLQQAKDFHAVSNEKILKNPKILEDYVKKDNLLYQEIENCKVFKKIMQLYELASAHFIIIFSLGMKLAENKANLKNIENIEKVHDKWRNSLAFKEEALGENLFYFFKSLTEKKRLEISPLLLIRFLTLNEVEKWLDNKLTDDQIKNLVESRQEHGFIYLNLRNEKKEVIDDVEEIKRLKKDFLKLQKESEENKNKKEIKGQATYISEKVIKGKVVVIKDKSKLKNKIGLIDGKILIAIQTTPHYIPYIKKALAIITDEGGITCHAAIISREMKIPCIVGTKIATRVFKTGDRVEINTTDGTIKILGK
jgi:phosphohistidine swiveling domain-containing protein